MTGWISVVKGAELWMTSIGVSVMAESPSAKPFTLSSGRTIRLLGVEKKLDPRPILEVGYISDCRFDQRECAENELKDILPEFRIEAEAQDCKEIWLRIGGEQGGGQTRFYCKQDDGTWNEDCHCAR
jgi:hypothetical protein